MTHLADGAGPQTWAFGLEDFFLTTAVSSTIICQLTLGEGTSLLVPGFWLFKQNSLYGSFFLSQDYWKYEVRLKKKINITPWRFEGLFFFFFLLHSVIIMWYFLPRANPNEFLPWPPDTWNSTSRNLFICCQLTVLWERIDSNTSQPFLP